MIRTYSDLSKFSTFTERFKYLKLDGNVGFETFGFDRYLNQKFYQSLAWKRVRNIVIARDLGCDLGIQDRSIFDKVFVHHMNPIQVNDIKQDSQDIIDPEYLITISRITHNAVHYGDESILPKPYIPRTPGDTKLW